MRRCRHSCRLRHFTGGGGGFLNPNGAGRSGKDVAYKNPFKFFSPTPEPPQTYEWREIAAPRGPTDYKRLGLAGFAGRLLP